MTESTFTSRSWLAALAVAGLVLTVGASDAHAKDVGGGWGEVVAGIVAPQAEDDYTDVANQSFKLGLRGGSWGHGAGHAGLEIAVDWTRMDHDYENIGVGGIQFASIDADRFRLQGGARFGTSIGKNLLLFGRVLGGVELVHLAIDVPQPLNDDDQNQFGLAMELGGGVLFDLGSVALGAQLALPIGIQFDEDDDEQSATDIDLDYTAVDIDLLLTVSSSF